MASESYKSLLEFLYVLGDVCENKEILEGTQSNAEWSNALNDCLSLAKKVARDVETARSLEQDSWGRFIDVICSESKGPAILPETLSILNVSLQIETVLSSVSISAEFHDCLMSLAHLAEVIENNHMSGYYLGEKLWKDLRLIVRQNESLTQMLNSIPRPKRTSAIPTYKEKFLNMTLKEKRKLYACKSDFKTLSQILSWQDAAPKKGLPSGKEPLYPVHCEMNQKISLYTGDITTLEIDAIVNSSNTALRPGGGVDGAIHRSSGPALFGETQTLNGLETGKAKITGGYLLPAKYVIHTAGPMDRSAEKLESCYKQCLKLLLENNLKTVAFPCISTGIYHYPNEEAAMVAINTVREFLQYEDNFKKVDRVIFCLFIHKDTAIYKELLPIYFPV